MIDPVLLHLWGPLSIHAYGLCITIGIAIALFLLHRDPKAQKIIHQNDLATALQYMILSGYVGGRLFCIINEYDLYRDYWFFIKFWEPGFSILGTIIAISVTMFAFLHHKKISVLDYSDRIALYAPLVQSFGRLGCFFAGCCYGQASTSFLAVTYNNVNHMAPLNIALYPTQLYSSVMLMGIFLLLYFFIQHRCKKSGMLLCSYLILSSVERFSIDFLRWDRSWWAKDGIIGYFSTNQWIALGLCLSAMCAALVLKYLSKKDHGSI